MPTIIERNGSFLARVRKDGFKPIAKTFSRKSDAKAWGLKVEADMQAGRWVEAADKVPTVAEALTTYTSAVVTAMKGKDKYGYWLDELAAAPFAQKPVNQVTAFDLAAWRDSQAKTRKPGTVARKMGLVSGFFAWCHKERGWIGANLLGSVRKPKVSDARDRVLTDDERRWLMAGAVSGRNDWLADALVVLLQSAMRRGELWALTVADVDAVSSVANLHDAKNGHGRQVPLCPAALASLLALAGRAQSEAASLRAARKPAPALGAERLVPVSDAPAISLAFRRALARGRDLYRADCLKRGVDVDAGFLAGVRLHDARHTAVTAWAGTGALSVHELQQVSGHRDLRSLGRYVNLKASTLAAKLATVTSASSLTGDKAIA